MASGLDVMCVAEPRTAGPIVGAAGVRVKRNLWIRLINKYYRATIGDKDIFSGGEEI